MKGKLLQSLACLAFLLSTTLVISQGVGLNETGASPDGNAILDIASSSQGLLIPRMSKAERNALSSPTEGLLVYQNDTELGFYYYDGTSWLQWKKTIAGHVSMGLTASTVDRGSGFTISHTQQGRDIITFAEPLTGIPDIALIGESLPGTVPSTPFDYCFAELSNCNDVHSNFVRLRIGGSGGTIFFDTGQNLCNPASSNYTFYKYGDPEYSSLPTLGAGTNMFLQSVRSSTASASNVNAFSVWMDWDQSGEFDAFNIWGIPELINAESGSITSTPSGSYNLSIPIPASANVCNGIITGRIMVRDEQIHSVACIDGAEKGETEDFEVEVSGGQDCSASYPARLVNCNILGATNSGFQVNCVDRFGAAINGQYNFKVIE